MSAREAVRRAVVWGLVALFFGAAIWLAVLGDWTSLLGFSAFPVVGAIILTSRPGNGVGRYLMIVGIYAIAINWTLVPELAAAAPAWLEAVAWAAAAPFWLSIPLVGLIFPSGRIETVLGRILFWALIGGATMGSFSSLVARETLDSSGRPNPFASNGTDWLNDIPLLVQVLALVAVMIGILVDLTLRWRRANPEVRLQYRWLVFGVAGLFVLVAIGGTINALLPDSLASEIFNPIATAAIGFIPVSIGIAVTRHGLYEIGRIVSRTVSYAAVTLLAIGVYALVVTSVSLLLPDQSTVPVAVATLVAAAVCLPALRWFQRVVARRFDREHYDAEKVVDAFGEHLRTGADPMSTASELEVAVERTLQPAALGLWTRRDAR